MASELDQLRDEELDSVAQALRSRRGRYLSDRAAQLAGVPLRTLNYWVHEGHLKSDYDPSRPKSWSYRDLVLIRLFVWLRSQHHPPLQAAFRVAAVRDELDRATALSVVRSHGRVVLLGDEQFD